MLRLLLFVMLALGISPARARPAPLPAAPINAFVEQSGSEDLLTLNNLLTGEQTRITVRGTQFSVVGREVLFFDEDSRRVQIASPNGELHEHPLIQPSASARRIDWIASPVASLMAWTVTEGTPDALSTTTYAASFDGADARIVLHDGPRAGIRAFPVAFSDDGATLYMDYQPDTIADLAPLRQYAALFALDLANGAASSLPGEPGCYCGGAIGSGKFLRLALAESGFDLRVTDLARDTNTIIPSLGLAEYTQAGSVLIAPSGAYAIYTLLQSAPGAEVRSLFVLADLINGTQRLLNPEAPETRILRPVEWLEDDQAVLLVDSATSGTWRLNVQNGALTQVASASFIGSTVILSGLR